MPVIQTLDTINANDQEDNLVAGSAFEFARTNQLVSMGLTAEAEGLVATIQTGSDIVLEESPIQVSSEFPIIPDEFYFQDVATPGDRIVIRVRNTTAGAIDVRSVVQVTNL